MELVTLYFYLTACEIFLASLLELHLLLFLIYAKRKTKAKPGRDENRICRNVGLEIKKLKKITRQIGPNIKQWVELDMVEKVTPFN